MSLRSIKNESAISLNQQKAPTLEDVAQAAGVSPATASRCINRPDMVREDRRLRIQAVVAELGYVPHGAARALASNRSMTIGALFPSLDSLLFSSFIGPLQRCLRAQGYTLVVSSSDYDDAMELQQLSNMVSNGVDGLVLVGTYHSPRVYEFLERKSVPFVLTWAWDEHHERPQIGFCNAAAAEAMASYLIDIGHRNIAMISGPTQGNDRAAERVAGVRRAMTAHGFELRPENFKERIFDLQEGARAFRELMTQPVPPTAVLCGTDFFAFGALFEAKRMGLEVPRDVSITGFDDTDLAASIVPSLTTMRTPRAEMAVQTAAFLIARLAGDTAVQSRKLDVELIVRQSSARPPERI